MVGGKIKLLVADIWQKAVKGAMVGLVIIMPGMSGGTMILVLGMYEKLMKDLAKLKFVPWIPFGVGMGGGIILSGWLFAWLFGTYTTLIMGFLLGCILASVRAVLADDYRLSIAKSIALLIGLAIGLALAGASDIALEEPLPPNIALVMIGGALSSAAMILPGVPGGSILIMMGIFDDIMLALANFDVKTLLFFCIGAVAGMLGLTNLLERLYAKHKGVLSWVFVGLIVGSGRVLIPSTFDMPVLYGVVLIVGFVFVWKWGSGLGKKKQAETNESAAS